MGDNVFDLNDEYMENIFLGKSEQLPAAVEVLANKAEQIIDTMVEYRELRMMYTCALKEIRTKFEVLNTEFNVRYQRNPINFITTRVKSTHSILEKTQRKHIDFTIASIEENINDIAGIRVICSYVDDIYKLADALIKQDDIRLREKKDYIKDPKPNGYRSLHLIVSVPVFFSNQRKEMKVEVQIRTIAMDFWASLEHQIKYKKEIPNQQEIVRRLRECADVISETDMTMQELRREMEGTDEPTPEDVFYEKIMSLSEPIE